MIRSPALYSCLRLLSEERREVQPVDFNAVSDPYQKQIANFTVSESGAGAGKRCIAWLAVRSRCCVPLQPPGFFRSIDNDILFFANQWGWVFRDARRSVTLSKSTCDYQQDR